MDKAKTLAEQYFEIVQNHSKENKGQNFICPVCGIKRIAKALTGASDEWLHTGCVCTHKWLSENHKLAI